MLSSAIPYSGLLVPGILVALLIAKLSSTFIGPLRSVPGPFLARFTRLWYASAVREEHFDKTIDILHKQYGPIVRVAPDWYCLSSPSVLKQVYGFSTKFVKADWYYGWEAPGTGGNLFASRDPKDHAERRRRVQALYSMTSLVGYETLVDDCIELFMKNVPKDQVCDLGHWLQCFAFDVIASITFGNRFGFLDEGKDVDGAINEIRKMFWYSTYMGIFNEFHATIYPIMKNLSWTGARGREYIRNFVISRVQERAADREALGDKTVSRDGMKEDFVDRMFAAVKGNPDRVHIADVAHVGISNINAGSDTTSGTLCGILYELIKSPPVLAKLRTEIEAIDRDGIVPFKRAFDLPYLGAVIKEAMRMHPVTGLPLWRKVPSGGATLDGQYFPAGTVVGVQTQQINMNGEIFADPETFKPERWLDASSEKLKEMDSTWATFGLGSRVCIGRHVSELEMYKIIPRVICEFDLAFERTGQQFETSNSWFVRPKDFNVKITVRKRK